MDPLEIGVCTWSIDRHDVIRGIDLTGNDLGLHVAQIGFSTEAAVKWADTDAILETAGNANVRLIGSFVAFEREDYSSVERIAETGGFTPDAEYVRRFATTLEVARLTEQVGCRSLAIHAGTIPRDSASPVYKRLVTRVREVADALADRNDMRLLLETGREPADVLLSFLEDVGRSNVGVNFDPANFLAFGTDEPARAVSTLASKIENVHMKDATRSKQPGVDYGRPAALGTGDADIAHIVARLGEVEYAGPLLVECSGSGDNLEAIRRATGYLQSLRV